MQTSECTGCRSVRPSLIAATRQRVCFGESIYVGTLHALRATALLVLVHLVVVPPRLVRVRVLEAASVSGVYGPAHAQNLLDSRLLGRRRRYPARGQGLLQQRDGRFGHRVGEVNVERDVNVAELVMTPRGHALVVEHLERACAVR